MPFNTSIANCYYTRWNSVGKCHRYKLLLFTPQPLNIHIPLYNTVCYNMVLDITWFKDGPQKSVDYIGKLP